MDLMLPSIAGQPRNQREARDGFCRIDCCFSTEMVHKIRQTGQHDPAVAADCGPLNTYESLTKQSLNLACLHLARQHKDLAQIIEKHGSPPLWARRPGFTTMFQIILEQQVSLLAARSMFQRLKNAVVPFTPERFLELGETHVKSLGLTRQKTAYCLHLAQSIVTKKFSLSSLSRLSDDEAKMKLMNLKGIGPWSADIYLLMALRRPDVWPTGDLALVTAVTQLGQRQTKPRPEELSKLAERWRPYRSAAARILWHYYLSERNGKNRSPTPLLNKR